MAHLNQAFCKQNPNYSEEAHQKRSERCKNAVTSEMRKTASERTVFNNFWEYRSKNPIIYSSKIAGDIKLDSLWEKIVAERLDSMNVNWCRPKTVLPWYDDVGKKHLYHPDFYIENYKCFLEVKSFFISKWQNSAGKCKYIKSHYPFVIWLETEEQCKNFVLTKQNFKEDVYKKEENIQYWLQKSSLKENKKIKAKKKKNKKSNSTQKKRKTKKDKKCNNTQKEELKLLKEEKMKEELKLLKESGIDFTKLGWAKKAALILKRSPAKVGNYIRKNFPELNAFLRNGKNSNEGKHWWNNGNEEISSKNCPKGWMHGRLKKRKSNLT